MVMNKSPGRGRRPGKPETRQQILEIAARRFLTEGFAAVTMRSVAAEAGVDAALVSYFFGSKQGLVNAALALSTSPADVLAAALPGDLDTLPERVLRALLTTWDDPATGAPLRAIVRTAAHDPAVGRLLREVVERGIVDQLAERLRGPDARARAGVFAAQVAGLIFSRYVLELEPIATMRPDELVRRLAPALRTSISPSRPRARG
jgi:AcrR family transcriptional regulator